MKSIINNPVSTLETQFFISRGEVFFPHNHVSEEFHQISCLCDNPFDDAYNLDATVKVEFLVDGKPVHEHNFIFEGGRDFESVVKDEVYYAIKNYPSKTPAPGNMIRITTTPEAV